MEQFEEKTGIDKIRRDDEGISKQTLKEKIRKLQQEREKFAEPSPFRKFNRLKIKNLDEEIERLMKRLGV